MRTNFSHSSKHRNLICSPEKAKTKLTPNRLEVRKMALPYCSSAVPCVRRLKSSCDRPSFPLSKNPTHFLTLKAALFSSSLSSISDSFSNESSASKTQLQISADSAPKARFVARRKETVSVQQLQRPLLEYMSLPASQYSVLDAERIERVDDNTFRCYVYRFKFFAFEVCPVLLVRVEEQSNGCSINLLSCKLEGSPIVVAQNDKFDAFMVNRISCDGRNINSTTQRLTSDAVIEVGIEIPLAFRALPVQAIESTGNQILGQILRVMLPRFMTQLEKDYRAWASGDTSRQPLGTGHI